MLGHGLGEVWSSTGAASLGGRAAPEYDKRSCAKSLNEKMNSFAFLTGFNGHSMSGRNRVHD
jgi:hypothetical protein